MEVIIISWDIRWGYRDMLEFDMETSVLLYTVTPLLLRGSWHVHCMTHLDKAPDAAFPLEGPPTTKKKT